MEDYAVYIYALGGIVAGLIQIGFGQVFTAVREIALNTRATAGSKHPAAYVGLLFIGSLLFITGVLSIALAALTVYVELAA